MVNPAGNRPTRKELRTAYKALQGDGLKLLYVKTREINAARLGLSSDKAMIERGAFADHLRDKIRRLLLKVNEKMGWDLAVLTHSEDTHDYACTDPISTGGMKVTPMNMMRLLTTDVR